MRTQRLGLIHRCRLFCAVLALCAQVLSAQGSVVLVGGGSEDYNDWSNQPYQWLVQHAPNRTILVLHYSTGSSWLEGYFKSLGAAAASSLVIASTAAANDSSVYRAILAADGLFLRGGDQWQYVSKWRGTLAEKAIREVFQRGGVVGGTSAGEAVLSEIVFDAQTTSVDPRAALRNPTGAGITLTDNFLSLAPGMLADSHFFERGRLGRLPVMMAQYRAAKGRDIIGVGVDANTAVAIGPDGIGEVMGSGTATILRIDADTRMTVETGKAFSAANIRFDQLTAGSTFAVVTGACSLPGSALPFAPSAVIAPPGIVILDGSPSAAGWSTESGTLRSLRSAVGASSDPIGIIASPAAPAVASSCASVLSSAGMGVRMLWIDEGRKNDPGTAAAFSGCAGFVFAGNAPDSLARLLDAGTQAGSAFAAAVAAGRPLVFIGDDIMLAGTAGIGQMYSNIYGAYYGYLTQVPGLGILKGLQAVPKLYAQSDYTDNLASGLFWSMGKSGCSTGILLDAGTAVVIAGTTITAWGMTPAMIIDAHASSSVGFPDWRDPGKANPRQNAGFTGARMHVLRDGDTYDAGLHTLVPGPTGEAAPEDFRLEQNFPNPFNPSTIIRYYVSVQCRVRLEVFDVLGRRVHVLVDSIQSPGMHESIWNARTVSSGVYFYRLAAQPLDDVRPGWSHTGAMCLVR